MAASYRRSDGRRSNPRRTIVSLRSLRSCVAAAARTIGSGRKIVAIRHIVQMSELPPCSATIRIVAGPGQRLAGAGCRDRRVLQREGSLYRARAEGAAWQASSSASSRYPLNKQPCFLPAAGGGVHHRRGNGAGTRRTPHAAGVRHGVIQDKLILPGFGKLLFSKPAGFLRPDKHHNIPHDEFLGEWNHTISPQQQPP